MGTRIVDTLALINDENTLSSELPGYEASIAKLQEELRGLSRNPDILSLPSSATDIEERQKQLQTAIRSIAKARTNNKIRGIAEAAVVRQSGNLAPLANLDNTTAEFEKAMQDGSVRAVLDNADAVIGVLNSAQGWQVNSAGFDPLMKQLWAELQADSSLTSARTILERARGTQNVAEHARWVSLLESASNSQVSFLSSEIGRANSEKEERGLKAGIATSYTNLISALKLGEGTIDPNVAAKITAGAINDDGTINTDWVASSSKVLADQLIAERGGDLSKIKWSEIEGWVASGVTDQTGPVGASLMQGCGTTYGVSVEGTTRKVLLTVTLTTRQTMLYP